MSSDPGGKCTGCANALRACSVTCRPQPRRDHFLPGRCLCRRLRAAHRGILWAPSTGPCSDRSRRSRRCRAGASMSGSVSPGCRVAADCRQETAAVLSTPGGSPTAGTTRSTSSPAPAGAVAMRRSGSYEVPHLAAPAGETIVVAEFVGNLDPAHAGEPGELDDSGNRSLGNSPARRANGWRDPSRSRRRGRRSPRSDRAGVRIIGWRNG